MDKPYCNVRVYHIITDDGRADDRKDSRGKSGQRVRKDSAKTVRESPSERMKPKGKNDAHERAPAAAQLLDARLQAVDLILSFQGQQAIAAGFSSLEIGLRGRQARLLCVNLCLQPRHLGVVPLLCCVLLAAEQLDGLQMTSAD